MLKKYWPIPVILLILSAVYGVERFVNYEPPARQTLSNAEVEQLLERALSIEGLRGQVLGDLETTATLTDTNLQIIMDYNRTCLNASGNPSVGMLNEIRFTMDLNEFAEVEFHEPLDDSKKALVRFYWKDGVFDVVDQSTELFLEERSRLGYDSAPNPLARFEVLEESTKVAFEFLDKKGIRSRSEYIYCYGHRTPNHRNRSLVILSFDPEFELVARELQARVERLK